MTNVQSQSCKNGVTEDTHDTEDDTHDVESTQEPPIGPTPEDTEDNVSPDTLYQLDDLSDDEEERLRDEAMSRSGTTASRIIADQVLADSEEEPSDTEEAKEPEKMSGRYREVKKPSSFKYALLERITPDSETGMNIISQTKMREETQ
jgi:hypothetical protein